MKFSDWNSITVAVVTGTFAVMMMFEIARPLRPIVEPKGRHVARNLMLAVISYLSLLGLQAPILVPFALWVQQEEIGLLSLISFPRALEVILAILVFDYTLWIWHWMSHKVPLLWRFHLVHHVDRDLDASTGLRFHFGELILSVGWRSGQIMLIGADLYILALWQAILFVSILFHHSNARLPERLERVLVWLVVTPRMHGIHHSDRYEHTNSNWSGMLTLWDILHRTLRLDVAQESIVTGVPAWHDPRDVTFGTLLVMPFVRQRKDWERSGE